MKTNLFLILLLLCSLNSLAQTKETNYLKISELIGRNYHPDSIAISKFCRIGCIFVKFKVTPKGDIGDISFSGDVDSNKFITNALLIAVNSLKHDANLVNFIGKSGREIIQPLVYNYQAGCSFPDAVTSDNNAVNNNSSYYLSYIKIMADMDHAYKSLMDMLNFKDKGHKIFDGVILSPIKVSLVVMH